MIDMWARQSMSLSLSQSVTLLALSVVCGLALTILAMRSDEEIYDLIDSVADDMRRWVLMARVMVLQFVANIRRG